MKCLEDITVDNVLSVIDELKIESTEGRKEAAATAVHILIQEGISIDNVITDTELCEKVGDRLSITQSQAHGRVRSFKKDFVKALPEEMQDKIIPVYVMLRSLQSVVVAKYLSNRA